MSLIWKGFSTALVYLIHLWNKQGDWAFTSVWTHLENHRNRNKEKWNKKLWLSSKVFQILFHSSLDTETEKFHFNPSTPRLTDNPIPSFLQSQFSLWPWISLSLTQKAVATDVKHTVTHPYFFFFLQFLRDKCEITSENDSFTDAAFDYWQTWVSQPCESWQLWWHHELTTHF